MNWFLIKSPLCSIEIASSKFRVLDSLRWKKEMANEDFIYRISTNQEWEEFQNKGSSFGGELDKSTGCFHLSKLNQVQSTLKNFFLNVKEDLYLLQVDPKKLGDGLIYEAVDEVNSFPHFYGPNKTFIPLPLDSVIKAEKLTFINGDFTCSFLT